MEKGLKCYSSGLQSLLLSLLYAHRDHTCLFGGRSNILEAGEWLVSHTFRGEDLRCILLFCFYDRRVHLMGFVERDLIWATWHLFDG
jgi:hypothetical protein